MWFDTHCHLQRFYDRGNLDELLSRSFESGVKKMVTVGTSMEDWELYAMIANRYLSTVFYSVGLHPSYVDSTWEDQVSGLKNYWGKAVKPLALGEVGLDYFRLPKDKAESEKIVTFQKNAFHCQLLQARELNCPVIIHSRNAFEDCVKMIDESGVDWNRVVFHCFSEGIEQLMQIQNRGGWVSFTGILTFKGNHSLRDTFKASDKEKVMLETDSPYLAPVPKRGTENEPSYLHYLGSSAAETLELPEKEFAEQIMNNSNHFYGC
jgi:TatD DNase family protein